MAEFELRSPAFESGEPIPSAHSCEGEDLSVPLRWSGLPEGTSSLALIVEDPDAPSGTFVHWLGWGIDTAADGLEEGEAAPLEGENGFGRRGYAGPCPPPGDGAHRYFHRLYALDTEVGLEAGVDRKQLDQALEGHVLAVAELVGTYNRT